MNVHAALDPIKFFLVSEPPTLANSLTRPHVNSAVMELGKCAAFAGIGGQVSGIVNNTEAASSILAIDGCPPECTRKSLEVAGFTKINHLILSDHGFEKGSTEVTQESIENVIGHVKKFL